METHLLIETTKFDAFIATMFPIEKRKQVSSARQRRRETVAAPDRVLTFVGADFPTWPLDHAHPELVKLLSNSRVYCGRALP